MNPILEKKIAIINSTIDMATVILTLSKEAFPKRRLFGKIDRRPLKRIKKKRARIALILAMVMGASQISIISSQPVRKFPSGAVQTNTEQ